MIAPSKKLNIGELIMLNQNNGTPELYESGISQANLGVMLVFWALLSYLTEGEFQDTVSDIEMSGLPKRRRSNRLFYMIKTPEGLKTASRAETAVMKAELPESLYAVWAINANEARQKIEQGKGERYSEQSRQANFAGQLLNCIAWQKVENKQGKEVTRCFIYAPNCKKKGCVRDTIEKRSQGLKPTAPKPKKQEIQSLRKEYRIQRMIEQAEEEHKAFLEGKTNQDWSLFTKESIEQYKNPKFEKVIENAWDITFAHYDKEFDKTYKSKLSGIYTSCKQYYRTAKGHLKCAKYALTCQTDPDIECANQKAPVPWAPRPEEPEFSEQAIKSVAKMLAEEMNQTLDDTKRIMRLVQYHGGIAPPKEYAEEYATIPSKYKSKEGLKMDELAQELGMNERELSEAINKAEDARLRLPKGKRRFSIKEMLFEAEKYLAQQASEGFAGLGAWSYKQEKAYKEIYGFLYEEAEKHEKELLKKYQTWTSIDNKIKEIANILTPDSFGHSGKLPTYLNKFLDELGLGGQMRDMFSMDKTPLVEVGDIVRYKGDLWEVGFYNSQHKRGTFRLQKGKTAHDEKVNYVYPDDMELIAKSMSLEDYRARQKEINRELTKSRSALIPKPGEKLKREPEQLKLFGKLTDRELDFYKRLRKDAIAELEIYSKMFKIPINKNKPLTEFWGSPTIADLYNEINPNDYGHYVTFLTRHNHQLGERYRQEFKESGFDPEKLRYEKHIDMRIQTPKPPKYKQMLLFGVEKESFDLDVSIANEILPDRNLSYKELYDIAKRNNLLPGAVQYAYDQRKELENISSPATIQKQIDRLLEENERIRKSERYEGSNYHKTARYAHRSNKMDWNAKRISYLREMLDKLTPKKAKPEQLRLFGRLLAKAIG